MGLACKASQTAKGSHVQRAGVAFSPRLFPRGQNATVRVNSGTVGTSLPTGRIVLTSERIQQQPVRLGASAGNGAGAGGDARPRISASSNVVATAAVVTTVDPSVEQEATVSVNVPVKATLRQQRSQPVFTPVPEDVIAEFEHKLEADLQTVGVTLTAILGVIIFWRGVWSLLDHFVGDSVVGDICCVIVGLTIVLYIRLSGMKIASFWPPS